MKNLKKLLACLCVSAACLTCMTQLAYATVAGHVQFVNGNVQIANLAGQAHPAHKGDEVDEGDTLTSAPASSAQIKMLDGGFVAMRPDTKLKFDKFLFNGKQDGSEKSFFSLFKGGFRAVTGLVGQANKQNYRITTATATIGIRGTDHETFLVVPGTPMALIAPTGAYSKVNVGETSMTTNKGTINVLPNQMGFAGNLDQAPKLQPLNTNIFTVAPAPTLAAKGDKTGGKNAGSNQGQNIAKGSAATGSGQAASSSAGTTGSQDTAATTSSTTSTTGGSQDTSASVRSTAAVDTVTPSASLIASPVATTVTPVAIASVEVPPAPTTVLNTTSGESGSTVNITAGTKTIGGVVTPVSSSSSGSSGTFAAYTGGQVAVEYQVPFSGGTELLVPAADVVTPVSNAATSGTQAVAFTQTANSNNGSYSVADTFSVTNPTTVTTLPSGIRFGANALSSATPYIQTASQPLGNSILGGGSGAPPQWIVGPQAYLDANGISALPTFATLNYSLDVGTGNTGGTSPIDTSSKASVTGTLNSATLNANLINMTVSATLGITIGGNSYTETNTAIPFTNGGNSNRYAANPFGASATVTGGAAAKPCSAATCGGYIQGAFTGQDYAGALLAYNLYDNNTGLNSTNGVAALVLTGGTNASGGSLSPLTPGTAAPTGNSFIGSTYGISQATSTSVTFTSAASGNVQAGVLTSFGKASTDGFNTTITCTACTATNAASSAATGISYGTWDQGTFTNTNTGSSGTLFWITGAEPLPIYLAQVLTGTVAYTYAGGAVGDAQGHPGSITTASLTANFTNQTMAVNLQGGAIGSASGWSATTPNALIGANCSGNACFSADSSRAQTQAGYLTVTIGSNTSTSNPGVSGYLSGQLVGNNLNGGILSFNLNDAVSLNGENIQGVAAFTTTTVNDPLTPYRLAVAMVNDPALGTGGNYVIGDYQSAANVMVTSGNLTQLNNTPSSGSHDTRTIAFSGGTSGSSFTGTSTVTGTACSPCSDPVTGTQWGRWAPGVTATTTNLVAGGTPNVVTVNGGGVHWLATPTLSGPVTLPAGGTYTYTLAGGTNPTDSSGNVGTLNSATLSANFTAQTVNVGANVTVNSTTIGAAASNVPINNMATFGTGTVTATCSGSACGTAPLGKINGAFVGAGATGAGMIYTFLPNSAVANNMIMGVAAFHR